MKEIRMKVKNNTNMTIKNGAIVFGRIKNLKFQKFLIWLRVRKTPLFSITGIDTSSFKKGDKLYLDPDKPGNLITKK